MPSGLLNADIGFPAFTGNESTEEKIGQISQYLYMLLEQLKYSLANIGVDNMTSGGVTELTQTVVNTPINITLGGGSPQSNTIGGAIDGINTKVNTQDGEIAEIKTLTDGLTLDVTNGQDYSVISLKSGTAYIGASKVIQFQGDVVFKSNLTDGSTIISGDNIMTGTIAADRINLQAAGIYPYRDTMGVTGVTIQNTSSTGTYNSIVIDNVGTAIYCKNQYNQLLGSIQIARGGVGLYFGSNSLVVDNSGVYANGNKIG